MNEMKKFEIGESTAPSKASGGTSAVLEFSPRDFLRQLWRNRRLFIGTVLLLTGLAVLITYQLTPRYKGEVLVMVAPSKTKLVGLESLLSGAPFGQETLNSEIAIIESRRFAGRVIKELKLDRDPEFNIALRGSGGVWFSIKSIFGSANSEKLSPTERREKLLVLAANNFLKSLEVKAVYQSRLLKITFSSTNAKMAARIANTVADLYLVDQLEVKFEATQRATKWLSGRIVNLRAAVERSERAIELYRREHGLVKGKDDTTIATSQISQVSSQLILAKAKQAEVQARLDQIEKLLKSKRGVESAAEVLSSALIQRLSERESQIIGKRAELAAVYGPKHPKMIAVRAEMNDLRRKIRLEVRKIVRQVRSEAEVAQARVVSLTKSLQELEGRSSQLNEKSIKLRSLQREAKANQTLLETVLARFKEATAQKGFQSPDARIISSAIVPARPYMPKVELFLGVAFLGSIMIGVMLVAVVEHLDTGFRSSERIEAMTGFPVLSLIPEIHDKTIERSELKNFLKANLLSSFAESLRGLRLSISLSNVDDPPTTVMVTSSSPEEGKSVLAFALAQVVVASPTEVILVDCDLRRPVVHEYFEVDRSPGLSDFLAGKVKLEDIVHVDKDSGLHAITAGSAVPNPSDILSSKQMKSLLQNLAGTYEMVVVDCPPVLAVNDARALGPSVDTAVFATRWGKVKREIATYAVQQLANSNVRVAGIALTRVEMRKHADYNYADSGHYHKKYAGYYTS